MNDKIKDEDKKKEDQNKDTEDEKLVFGVTKMEDGSYNVHFDLLGCLGCLTKVKDKFKNFEWEKFIRIDKLRKGAEDKK